MLCKWIRVNTWELLRRIFLQFIKQHRPLFDDNRFKIRPEHDIFSRTHSHDSSSLFSLHTFPPKQDRRTKKISRASHSCYERRDEDESGAWFMMIFCCGYFAAIGVEFSHFFLLLSCPFRLGYFPFTLLFLFYSTREIKCARRGAVMVEWPTWLHCLANIKQNWNNFSRFFSSLLRWTTSILTIVALWWKRGLFLPLISTRRPTQPVDQLCTDVNWQTCQLHSYFLSENRAISVLSSQERGDTRKKEYEKLSMKSD